jgi:hypothetical protein
MTEHSPLEPALRDALRSSTLPDPERQWHRIRGRLDARESAPTRPLRIAFAAAAIVAAVAIGAAAGVAGQFAAPATWPMAALQGSIGPRTLRAGDALVTDEVTTVQLDVGRIGTATIAPGSRVRRAAGRWSAHRLVLDRGTIDAVITAPPRLFFVQTPSAMATDLGCAYRLTVTEDGASELYVSAGWVELEHEGQRSIVPAGLAATVRPGGRPGIPVVPTIDDTTRLALHRLDSGTGSDADLARVLTALTSVVDPMARQQQSGITLWHLLQRVEGAQRNAVVGALSLLAPPPADVTMPGILALDPPMLDRWRRALNPMWGEESDTVWSTLTRRVWYWLND